MNTPRHALSCPCCTIYKCHLLKYLHSAMGAELTTASYPSREHNALLMTLRCVCGWGSGSFDSQVYHSGVQQVKSPLVPSFHIYEIRMMIVPFYCWETFMAKCRWIAYEEPNIVLDACWASLSKVHNQQRFGFILLVDNIPVCCHLGRAEQVRRVLGWGTFLPNVSTGGKPGNFMRVPDVSKQKEDMKKVVGGEGSFKVSQLRRSGAKIRTHCCSDSKGCLYVLMQISPPASAVREIEACGRDVTAPP